jgi:hypothetical protein
MGQPALPRARGRIQVTPRGAVAGMLAVFFASTLAGGWLHAGMPAGIGFVAGAVLAAAYIRRDSLPIAVTTPPALFGMAVIAAQALGMRTDSLRHAVLSLAEGAFLTLAPLTPWLLAGTATSLAVALARGLPQCLRDLSAEMRGETDPRALARGGPQAGARKPSAPAPHRPPAPRRTHPRQAAPARRRPDPQAPTPRW